RRKLGALDAGRSLDGGAPSFRPARPVERGKASAPACEAARVSDATVRRVARQRVKNGGRERDAGDRERGPCEASVRHRQGSASKSRISSRHTTASDAGDTMQPAASSDTRIRAWGRPPTVTNTEGRPAY